MVTDTKPIIHQVGLILIGDELLSGRREDRHLSQTLATLEGSGIAIAWVQMVGDERQRLARFLAFSREGKEPVFCFGGIGATPDDHTRQAAGIAWNKPLVRHPVAAQTLVDKFGEEAFPHRIRMGEFPQGAGLIPNPINDISGFYLDDHHFLPGFPDMAQPMLSWVIGHRYQQPNSSEVVRGLTVKKAREGDMIPILAEIEERFPGVISFSLPGGQGSHRIEMGVKGREVLQVESAFQMLQERLREVGLTEMVLEP
ncbi:MAG: competence/damage-inducible protein A [Magnetococcales bacterium]|nr:competence/damage-inducible protein A [Magnetococcales bacterium]